MAVFSALIVDSVAKAVTPVAFELERFEPRRAEAVRLTFVHANATQTLNAWLETRAKYNSGTWIRHPSNLFDAIDPAAPTREDEVSVAGAGEVRVMGTASGAGITVTYSRRMVHRELPR